MDPADHVQTSSYGNGPEAMAYRQEQARLIQEGGVGGFEKAMQMDAADLARDVFEGKYTQAMEEAVKYFETIKDDLEAALRGNKR